MVTTLRRRSVGSAATIVCLSGARSRALAAAGHDVAVYNRTRAKAEPLAELGATIVDTPAELGDRDIVFTMVAGPDDFKEVVLGEQGILSGATKPRLIVDIWNWNFTSLGSSSPIRMS